MTPADVRTDLTSALRLDLVGPEPDDAARAAEVLPTSPSSWYLTGFLVPFEAADSGPMEVEQLDALGARPGVDDDVVPEQASKRKAPFPSSIGVSVLVPHGVRILRVRVTWGDYEPLNGVEGESLARAQWTRTEHAADLVVAVDEAEPVDVADSGGLRIELASRPVVGHTSVPEGTRAVSVFLVNRRPPSPDVGRDVAYAFQVRLVVVADQPFVARLDLRGHGGSERDDRVAELQYRDVYEHAVGHGVATVAEVGEDGACRAVRTEWIPSADVERASRPG